MTSADLAGRHASVGRWRDLTECFQSKQPAYFAEFLGEFPGNVILLTTLETNRDAGYEQVSKAPPPSERYRQFQALDFARKVVTIEPVMDFDLATFRGDRKTTSRFAVTQVIPACSCGPVRGDAVFRPPQV